MFIILTHVLKSSGENTRSQNKCPMPEAASLLVRKQIEGGLCTVQVTEQTEKTKHITTALNTGKF